MDFLTRPCWKFLFPTHPEENQNFPSKTLLSHWRGQKLPLNLHTSFLPPKQSWEETKLGSKNGNWRKYPHKNIFSFCSLRHFVFFVGGSSEGLVVVCVLSYLPPRGSSWNSQKPKNFPLGASVKLSKAENFPLGVFAKIVKTCYFNTCPSFWEPSKTRTRTSAKRGWRGTKKNNRTN